MCGFVGLFSPRFEHKEGIDTLNLMGEKLRHRGPDSNGVWFDADSGIGFSHQRLAIQDLSEAGHQPMASSSGRFVIAFNGEIYNHLDIREEIVAQKPQCSWRGHSDTETLLTAIELWGVESAIEKSVGMFAFSLWDCQNEELILARDRLGEKPLYYGWAGSSFIFASELSAVRAFPGIKLEINRNAITLLLRHNYIPAPYSIYNGFKKLPPGHINRISFKEKSEKLTQYWSLLETCRKPKEKKYVGNEKLVVDELESILKAAVKEQMISDVSLGAFLSGGVDSSTVVSLMQAESKVPVKTFSIGFHEKEYNEAVHAKAVANHLGTDHTELYVKPEDALAVIPKLVDLYDEPFSDSSQIPTYIVAELAKKHVTVALSGDGGDEIFCGYNRYLMTKNVWRILSKFPLSSRKLMSRLMLKVSIEKWNKINTYLPTKVKMQNLGDKMHKAAGVVTSESIDELYLGLVSHWPAPENVVLNAKEPLTALTDDSKKPDLEDPTELMMALDSVSYLPDDILVKVDRASMGVSLEGRIPMLNHKVIEFAWKIPMQYKLRDGQSKWCLRELLYRYVPKELIERPKMGFGMPIGDWLRGPLKEWADSLLDEERLKEEGYFDATLVRQMWNEHLDRSRNWQYHLWDILMFQIWFEKHHKLK